MRHALISRSMREFLIAGLALTAAGCSSGPQDGFQTSSLAPRPQEGMNRNPPPPYAQTGYSRPSDRPYQPYYSQPSTYSQPTTSRPMYSDPGMPTRSYDAQPYEPPRAPAAQLPPQQYYGSGQPQWQPAPQRYGTPITTGSLGPRSQTIVVHEGDTLYGLSRRYGVSVADLASANHVADGKVDIGQTLVIPR